MILQEEYMFIDLITTSSLIVNTMSLYVF